MAEWDAIENELSGTILQSDHPTQKNDIPHMTWDYNPITGSMIQ